ncbi:MAG: hypothetical protein ABI894_12170 [Ilumatobacteraceae bacterium]
MKQVRSVFIGVLIASAWGAAAHAAPPTEPPPEEPTTTVAATTIGPPLPAVETPPPIVDPNVVSAPLVGVPTACNNPPAPIAVFVGTLAAADTATGRFAVQQIRAGSLDGYAVNTIVDVRYDDDIRFLHIGQQYLVGAILDPLLKVLSSKVRLEAPLFGGDAVIGVDDTDVQCPRVEDGVKTLLANGSDVDTGVLAPLSTAKRSLVRAILKPLAIAFAILAVLASMKLLIFAMVRAAREPAPDEEYRFDVQRDRQHADGDVDMLDDQPADDYTSQNLSDDQNAERV